MLLTVGSLAIPKYLQCKKFHVFCWRGEIAMDSETNKMPIFLSLLGKDYTNEIKEIRPSKNLFLRIMEVMRGEKHDINGSI